MAQMAWQTIFVASIFMIWYSAIKCIYTILHGNGSGGGEYKQENPQCSVIMDWRILFAIVVMLLFVCCYQSLFIILSHVWTHKGLYIIYACPIVPSSSNFAIIKKTDISYYQCYFIWFHQQWKSRMSLLQPWLYFLNFAIRIEIDGRLRKTN